MSAAAADPRVRRRAGEATVRVRRARRLGTLRAALVLGLIGLFLAIMVALNVAALRANMRAGELQSETRDVTSRIGQAQADLAALRSGDRIATAARASGMVLPREGATKVIPEPGAAARKAATVAASGR